MIDQDENEDETEIETEGVAEIESENALQRYESNTLSHSTIIRLRMRM